MLRRQTSKQGQRAAAAEIRIAYNPPPARNSPWNQPPRALSFNFLRAHLPRHCICLITFSPKSVGRRAVLRRAAAAQKAVRHRQPACSKRRLPSSWRRTSAAKQRAAPLRARCAECALHRPPSSFFFT